MTVVLPIPDYAESRSVMIESQLRPQGVTDGALLSAISSIAREAFVPADARPMAYSDRAVPLGNGRFLGAPTALGQLLMNIAPERGEKALVVGGASGYSATILVAMGVAVTLLESDPALIAGARANSLAPIEGALAAGHPPGAPYAIILVDGAVDHIPDALIAQLADGGRLGAALIDRSVTRLVVGRKSGDAFGFLSLGDAGVPALPGFTRPPAFTF